ncbi:hypothetical protein C1X72_15490 [Pseudomonas sp. FW306-2-2C-D06B]|uniref:hypothetical protein n=1 Tax=unclassified Pseudomonas TaxID=196821 RepID=UPI000C88BED1|nr:MULTISPECIES: hypothetical protein [unclassified Pseudomonas]PMY80290.1 hypothetical protein C1X72_15490 [Pseudomonas sp. FW306-2-2C-D06B]PNA98407.1 hypothetical protein C1X74_11535 [Pseudomonas sp. GW460-5]PNB58865.1 hypothetical protein C1X73_12625 [Pseudomonas sp. FW305-130]POA73627.1 hypothetical protein C1890_27035 [Pseudomonas sp. DP16D-R1]
MERTSAAKLVNAASLVAMLAVGWQAVRFIMGDIGNPISPVYEFVTQSMREMSGLPPKAPASELSGGPLSWLIGGYQSIMVWGLGLVFWLFSAFIVGELGKAIARVVQVGWQQYRVEQREAQQAARIAAERQAVKDRRRELRRKALQAVEPRRGASGTLLFILGVLVGSFFL